MGMEQRRDKESGEGRKAELMDGCMDAWMDG